MDTRDTRDSGDDGDGGPGHGRNVRWAQRLRKWKDYFLTWLYPSVAYLAVVGAVVTLTPSRPSQPVLETFLFGFVAFWTFMWASFAFSGDPYLRRTHALGFAYFFILVSFGIFCLPAFFGNAVGSEPVGIVSGCVPDAAASEQVRCLNPAVVLRQSVSLEGAATAPAAPSAVPAAPAAAPQLMQLAPSSMRNHWLVNVGGTLRPQSPKCDEQVEAGKRNVEPSEACKLGSPGNRVYVSGGLVVPLPFVIIALVGGAISLSRRVPEIQRKSETYDYVVPRAIRHTRSLYVPAVAKPELTAADVRQDLVFQIVQFASAPLLAVVAFQIIEPESAATSASLAFMCGFGSEAVLRWIKSVAGTIGRRGSEQAGWSGIAAATGGVFGVVKLHGVPQPHVNVSVEGAVAGTCSTSTDKNGLYSLAGIRAGAQLLVVDGYRRPVIARVRAGEANEYPIELADLEEAEPAAATEPAGQQPARQQPAGEALARQAGTR